MYLLIGPPARFAAIEPMLVYSAMEYILALLLRLNHLIEKLLSLKATVIITVVLVRLFGFVIVPSVELSSAHQLQLLKRIIGSQDQILFGTYFNLRAEPCLQAQTF